MKLFLILKTNVVFFFVTLLIISGCQTHTKKTSPSSQPIDCHHIRAAFDIGSGETKMKVAKVDSCKLIIEEILLEDKRDINYKGDLEKSKNNNFSDEVIKEGTQALIELKNEALKHKPDEFTSVATAAFRDARNAQKYVESLNHELNLNIQIIPQQEEGVLGFYAARTKATQMDPKKSIVWDIGGGSQQIVMETINKKGHPDYLIYEGKVASTTFKNYVIEKIQKRKSNSPNPLKESQSKSALAYAKDVARRTIKKPFREAIQNGYKVYGIGGVHNYSIKGQLNNQNIYTIENLIQITLNRINKSDEELGNTTYVASDTTNPILIRGFMEDLEISNIEVLKVNLADGLLINHKYWTP